MGNLHDVSRFFDDPVVESQYKFIYPEFDGAKGYDLLSDILAAILPTSLHLTWLALTRVQKDEKLPYGGVGYLMKARARSDRKVEMDIKTFKDKGLMTTIPGIEIIAGQARRVDYKDFRDLYELAHKYYLWTYTNDSLLHQPTFEDAESIRRCDLSDLSDKAQALIAPFPTLHDFLVQFENYRLKLMCSKPGRKPRRPSSSRIDKSQSEECTTGTSGHVLQDPKRNFIAPSPYESTPSTIDSMMNESNQPQTKDQILKSINQLEDAQGVYDASSTQFGDSQENFRESSAQGYPLSFSEHKTDGGHFRETATSDKSEKSERYNRAKASEALRRKYPDVVRLCAHFSVKFHDMGGKGTLTDICKLFEKSQRSEKDFIELMEYAGRKTAGRAEGSINVRNMDGSANKMPYFMSIIRKSVASSQSVLQLEEADRKFAEEQEQARLSQEKDTFTNLDVPMSGDQDIQQSSNSTTQISEFLDTQQSPENLSAQDDVVEEPMVDGSSDHSRQQVANACREIRFLTNLPIYRRDACDCGNTIMAIYKKNMRCVLCNPPEVWGEYLRARVRKIILSNLKIDPPTKVGPISEIEQILLTVQDTVILVEKNCCYCQCPILIQRIDPISGRDMLFCVSCQPDPVWPSQITDQIQSILANEPDRATPSLPSRAVADAEQIALMNDLKNLVALESRSSNSPLTPPSP